MRRRGLLTLLAGAACAAAAIPILALAAPGDELPDLRADAPDGAFLQRNGSTDPRLLLRFDGYVTNIGEGPLDINGNPSAGTMQQRVRNGGTFSNVRPVEVKFETADGHNHWHLMRISRYSLWNQAGTAEVAPGQKVGFCLYDIQGGASRVPGSQAYEAKFYAPANFCSVGNPGATSLRMGVSPGWRDVYDSSLALQWVDVLTTAPGTYRLAAEADPENKILESNESNPRKFAAGSVTIPGYVAQPVGPIAVPFGAPTSITLKSQTVSGAGLGTGAFRIESDPPHGSLNADVGDTVTATSLVYQPDPGYSGPDSFTFSAITTTGDTRGFPRSPAKATASIQVGARIVPTVQISGAPARLVAGLSAQLSAAVTNAGPQVTWSASAGTVTPAGLFVAPATVPAGGTATVRATSAGNPDAFADVVIGIDPPPAQKPAPLTPGSGPVLPATSAGIPSDVEAGTAEGGLTIPTLTRSGRIVVVRVVPRRAGRIVITAIRGGRALDHCSAKAVAGTRVTCLLTVPKKAAGEPVRIAIALKTTGGPTSLARALSRP